MKDTSRIYVETGSWFTVYGAQMLLMPWVALNYLYYSADELGWIQASYQLPLLLLPIMGVIVERQNKRAVLLGCHIAAGIPLALMAYGITSQTLTFAWLLALGIGLGLVTAFAMPARDSLTAIVGRNQMQRMVSIVTGIQFGSQAIGLSVASQTDLIGPVAVLIFQIAVMWVSAIFILREFDVETKIARAQTEPLPAISYGKMIEFLLADRTIRTSCLLSFSVGLLFIGCFQVAMPTKITLELDLGSNAMGIALITFMIGTICATFFLVSRGGVLRAGRTIMLALTGGAFICLGLSYVTNFYLIVGLLFLWGVGAGCTVSLNRTLVQERAPDEMTARIMSVFQLALLGGAPVGNLIMGYSSELFETRGAFLAAFIGMLAVLGYVWAKGHFWHVQSLSKSNAIKIDNDPADGEVVLAGASAKD